MILHPLSKMWYPMGTPFARQTIFSATKQCSLSIYAGYLKSTSLPHKSENVSKRTCPLIPWCLNLWHGLSEKKDCIIHDKHFRSKTIPSSVSERSFFKKNSECDSTGCKGTHILHRCHHNNNRIISKAIECCRRTYLYKI